MSNKRTHFVTTSDAVTIGATVAGQGPSLVFLQGIMGDGDLDWHSVLPHLTGRFTCHLPSLRGRGLSGDHPDLSIGRLVEDVLAYVDSIEPLTHPEALAGALNEFFSTAQPPTVANRPVASTVSRSSTTSIVDDSVWGRPR